MRSELKFCHACTLCCLDPRLRGDDEYEEIYPNLLNSKR